MAPCQLPNCDIPRPGVQNSSLIVHGSYVPVTLVYCCLCLGPVFIIPLSGISLSLISVNHPAGSFQYPFFCGTFLDFPRPDMIFSNPNAPQLTCHILLSVIALLVRILSTPGYASCISPSGLPSAAPNLAQSTLTTGCPIIQS